MGAAIIDPPTCNNVSRHVGILMMTIFALMKTFVMMVQQQYAAAVIVKHHRVCGFELFAVFSSKQAGKPGHILLLLWQYYNSYKSATTADVFIPLLVINHPPWADICVCTDFTGLSLPQILFIWYWLLHYKVLICPKCNVS